MRFPQATRDDLTRLALWLTVEDRDLRGLIDHAIDTVDAVKTADVWQQARAATSAHEEVPFAICESVGGTRVLTNGTIDLVFGTDPDWHIADYKTDLGADTAELTARYAKQVQTYEAAWKAIAGGTVSAKVVSARK